MLYSQHSAGIFETIDHSQSYNFQNTSCKIRQGLNIKTFYILSNDSVHFCDHRHFFGQQLETFFEIATHI
jgi:antirestriction protein ArdC